MYPSTPCVLPQPSSLPAFLVCPSPSTLSLHPADGVSPFLLLFPLLCCVLICSVPSSITSLDHVKKKQPCTNSFEYKPTKNVLSYGIWWGSWCRKTNVHTMINFPLSMNELVFCVKVDWCLLMSFPRLWFVLQVPPWVLDHRLKMRNAGVCLWGKPECAEFHYSSSIGRFKLVALHSEQQQQQQEFSVPAEVFQSLS